VRNTADNLELVDALVEQASICRAQTGRDRVKVCRDHAKQLERTWIRLAAWPVHIGNQNSLDPEEPLVPARQRARRIFLSWTRMENPIGQNPVTSGNRNGTARLAQMHSMHCYFPRWAPAAWRGNLWTRWCVHRSAISSRHPARSIRKRVDLLSAPRVTTKSGQRAVIEIVREFRYPTTFTPPQIPSLTSARAARPYSMVC